MNTIRIMNPSAGTDSINLKGFMVRSFLILGILLNFYALQLHVNLIWTLLIFFGAIRWVMDALEIR